MSIMRVREWIKYSVAICLLSTGVCAHAQTHIVKQPHPCELGVQAGCGYYVGDATPHIFMNVREAYGIHFRYKFTKRWSIQAKVSGQRITGDVYDMRGDKQDEMWTNRMYHLDAMAEFNFFRFGSHNKYDKRTRPYTPYIFAGIGMSLYNDITVADEGHELTAAGYIPLGFGFKWKFHEYVGLNIAWQHNIYFSDDIEGQKPLNDKHHLNGSNWMNCDVTGMLTVGMVFEFHHEPRKCRICEW